MPSAASVSQRHGEQLIPFHQVYLCSLLMLQSDLVHPETSLFQKIVSSQKKN